MPASQPAEAYYYDLDNAFSNAPSTLTSRKSLPRKRIRSDDIITSAGAVGPVQSIDPESYYKQGRTEASPLASVYPLNGHDAALPPTPPSNSNERVRSPTHAEPVRSSLSHKVSNATPPLAQRSPPTPDLTPPGSLSVPQQQQQLQQHHHHHLPPRPSPSSRAESYKTAREEQWSSADEEEEEEEEEEEKEEEEEEAEAPYADLGLDIPTRVYESRDRDAGLGLAFERTDDESTPTQERSPKPAQTEGMEAEKAQHIPDREWDTNLMRNVTVRRRRPHSRRVQPTEDETRLAEREVVPQLVTASSEEEDVEPQTPSPKELMMESEWKKGSIRDDDSNRHSTTSTIVEAVIVASPPQRRQTLRHVSKTISLRSEPGSSAGSSPVTKSNRTSLGSEDIFSHRLSHRRGSINDGRRRSSPALHGLSSTPPVALKHHGDSASLRADANASKREGSQSRRTSLGSNPTSMKSPTKVSVENVRQRNVSAPISLLSQRNSPRERRSRDSRPLKVQFEDPPSTHSPPKAKPVKRVVSNPHPTRVATQKALQRVDDEMPPPEPKIRKGTLDANVRKARQPSTGSETSPKTRSAFNSVDTASEPLSVVQGLLSPKTDHPRRSIESAPAGNPRASFDHRRSSSYENTRLSVDQSTIRTDEHGQARHLTPFSQTSDTHDPLEVSEATAINIYPHNNNSLLVVQQVGRPTLKELADGADPMLITGELPGFSLQPATPPQLFAAEIPNVDSPLRNPRKPPQVPLQLPAIRVLPATPAEELESPLDEVEVQPKPLTRSLSLKQRAQRYSNTVVRPIIARTSSLRRSYYSRPRSPYRQYEPSQQATNLHPFWQPRGFWDEFSDSDSDFGEPEEGAARLPPGGDTSDVPDPPKGLSRMLSGFRGSGGFLIGNSLGVERHGSNNRRHHISLPTGLGRSRSGRVVRKTSESTLRSMDSLRNLRRAAGERKVWQALGLQFHYLGINGMKLHMREKRAEKRRERLRKSIGPMFVVEGAPVI
jgi:hypothetical protein